MGLRKNLERKHEREKESKEANVGQERRRKVGRREQGDL